MVVSQGSRNGLRLLVRAAGMLQVLGFRFKKQGLRLLVKAARMVRGVGLGCKKNYTGNLDNQSSDL